MNEYRLSLTLLWLTEIYRIQLFLPLYKWRNKIVCSIELSAVCVHIFTGKADRPQFSRFQTKQKLCYEKGNDVVKHFFTFSLKNKH